MSYIVPIEKPKECWNCRFLDRNVYDCELMLDKDYEDFYIQYANCPLVEVPTSHGRLIDADELMTEVMDSDLDHLQRDDWKEVIQILEDAPTIIEAEGSEK